MKHDPPLYTGGWNANLDIPPTESFYLVMARVVLAVTNSELKYAVGALVDLVPNITTVLQNSDVALVVGEPWRSAILIWSDDDNNVDFRPMKMWSRDLWETLEKYGKVVCLDAMSGSIRHVIVLPPHGIAYAGARNGGK